MPEDIKLGSERAGEVAVQRSVPEWVMAAVRMNQHNSGLAPVAGNRVEIHAEYVNSIDATTEAVGQAESFVHVQFYILASDHTTDRFSTALEEAYGRGVTVRVLLDHAGSLGFPGYKAATERLEKAGIPWRLMLPVASPRFHYQRPDLRNHRKTVVIDNQVGFTGSQNMIDASYNKKHNRRKKLQYLDLMVRLEGPVVPQINAVFIVDWASETEDTIPNKVPVAAGRVADRVSDAASGSSEALCQVLPSGPGLGNENNLRLFNQLLYSEAEYREASTKLEVETWQKRPWHQKFLDNACRLTSNLQ